MFSSNSSPCCGPAVWSSCCLHNNPLRVSANQNILFLIFTTEDNYIMLLHKQSRWSPFIKWSMVGSQWQSISWHVTATRSAIAYCLVHGMPRQRWSKVLRRHYFAHYFWEITKKNHILKDHPLSKDEISLPRGTHLCKQGEQLPLLVDSRVSWRGQADQDQTWIGGCSLCLLWRGVGQIIQGV